MPRIDSKAVVRRAKEKPKKGNYTFRFDNALMEKFKAACEKEQVKMTGVLEELMAAFLDGRK